MAEKKTRRPFGQLQDIVVQLLRSAKRPLSAVALIEEVRKRRPALQSQVFRELARLRRSGGIRKIHIAGGYVSGGDTRQISLFCTRCGKLAGVPCEALFGELDATAIVQGYRSKSYVVEVAGVCARCARA